MPYNGSGQFNRLYSWQADKAAGIDISSSRMDSDTNDITSAGLSAVLTRDGQGQPTSNLPMAGFRHTGAGSGVANGDYVTIGQLKGAGGSAFGATPVGSGLDFYGTVAPAGWIFANGAAVSRATYAALFTVIGTAYGSGDGTTTFNLPDKRGRISLPLDNLGGSAAGRVTVFAATAVGDAGGDQNAQAHTHTITDPGHTHTAGVTDPGHAHALTDPGHSHTLPGAVLAAGSGIAGGSGQQYNGASTNSATTGLSVNGSGTGVSVTNTPASTGITVATAESGAAQNMPPVLVCSYIIYAGV